MSAGVAGPPGEAAAAPERLVFQAGYALRPGSFYLRRSADEELKARLLAGAVTTVLAPRQIGKSSLRVRVATALRAEGLRAVELDLSTSVGGEEAAFYRTLCDNLASGLGLTLDLADFWADQEGLAGAEALLRFLRREVLARVPGRVVVFLDEVDALLGASFSRDDFFAALRAAATRRAEDAEWQRLTFCLLGVATATELMRDAGRTPFNGAVEVRLLDFTDAEAAPLAVGLAELPGGDGASWLAEVLRWSGGHPYMTQKVCEALVERAEEAAGAAPAVWVARLVEELFLEQDDANLSFAERRLREREAPEGLGEALALYRRLLRGESLPLRPESAAQMALRLAGMATLRRGDDGRLWIAVRNRVFARRFDEAWVVAQEGGRALLMATNRWQEAGRDAALLLRGEVLAEAKAWAAGPGREEVTRAELGYLSACEEAAGQEALAARAAKEARRLRWLVAGLMCLVLLLGGVSWLALRGRRRAEQAERAQRAYVAALRGQQPGNETAALVDAVLAAGPDWRQGMAAPILIGLAQASEAQELSLPLEGHEGGVRSAVFSRDDKWVLTASADKTARLWDAWTGRELQRLVGHRSRVRRAVFSPEGERVLTASDGDEDMTARIWDARTGKELQRLEGHWGELQTAVFSPDGERVLTASADKTARIWDSRSGRELQRLEGHVAGLQSAVFSPDGERALTSGIDTTVRLWDAQTGKEQQSLGAFRDPVGDAVFSPDGDLIATTAAYGFLSELSKTAQLWDVRAGWQLQRLEGHSSFVNSAVFAPHGDRLLTASMDKTARIWDVRTGKELLRLEGHREQVDHAEFSPDGEQVVTRSSDGTVRLWDGRRGKEFGRLKGHRSYIGGATFSSDGSRLLTASYDKTARIWAAQGERDVRRLEGHSGTVWSVALSPDGALALTTSADKTVRLWDARGGRELRRLEGHKGSAPHAEFSPDGESVLTVGSDRTARLWDVHSGRELRRLLGPKDEVLSALFAPDGQRILTNSVDGMTRLWEVRSGQVVWTLRSTNSTQFAPLFSPDGQRVLVEVSDSSLVVGDAQTGRMRQRLVGHKQNLFGAVFSANGERVLSRSADKTVRLWDARSGRSLWLLKSDGDNYLDHALFSPDGENLLTAESSTGQARLWDARSGRELRRFEGYAGYLVDAVFSPDGERLLAGSYDNIARLWDVRTGKELRRVTPRLRWGQSVASRTDGSSGAQRSLFAFSSDGTHFIAALSNEAVIVPSSDVAFLSRACDHLRVRNPPPSVDILRPDFDQARQICATVPPLPH